MHRSFDDRPRKDPRARTDADHAIDDGGGVHINIPPCTFLQFRLQENGVHAQKVPGIVRIQPALRTQRPNTETTLHQTGHGDRELMFALIIHGPHAIEQFCGEAPHAGAHHATMGIGDRWFLLEGLDLTAGDDHDATFQWSIALGHQQGSPVHLDQIADRIRIDDRISVADQHLRMS